MTIGWGVKFTKNILKISRIKDNENSGKTAAEALWLFTGKPLYSNETLCSG